MSRSPRTAGSPVSCRRASWSGSYTSMMPTGTWSRGAGRITIAWVSQAFARFLDGRAWTHAEGPVTLFEQATGRLRRNIRRLRGGRRALRLVFAVAGVVAVEARRAADARAAAPAPQAGGELPTVPQVTSLTLRRLAALPADTRPLPTVSAYDQLLTRPRTVQEGQS